MNFQDKTRYFEKLNIPPKLPFIQKSTVNQDKGNPSIPVMPSYLQKSTNHQDKGVSLIPPIPSHLQKNAVYQDKGISLIPPMPPYVQKNTFHQDKGILPVPSYVHKNIFHQDKGIQCNLIITTKLSGVSMIDPRGLGDGMEANEEVEVVQTGAEREEIQEVIEKERDLDLEFPEEQVNVNEDEKELEKLNAQFKMFSKFGNRAADGSSIKLSQSDKWFRQVGRSATTIVIKL